MLLKTLIWDMSYWWALCRREQMIKLKIPCVILFGFRKGKADNFSCQLRAILYFWSSLASLAIVMWCLIRVGVPQVSWAVRYLDKAWWRGALWQLPWYVIFARFNNVLLFMSAHVYLSAQHSPKLATWTVTAQRVQRFNWANLSFLNKYTFNKNVTL